MVTGKVPADSGTVFLRARFPAIARIGITVKNLPSNVAIPVDALYQGMLAVAARRMLNRYCPRQRYRRTKFATIRAALDW